MGFDARAEVRDGRLVLEGLPVADGPVRVQVTPVEAVEVDRRPPGELSDEEWIARVRRVAKEMHARHPDGPILTDYDMSRESIYADEGL